MNICVIQTRIVFESWEKKIIALMGINWAIIITYDIIFNLLAFSDRAIHNKIYSCVFKHLNNSSENPEISYSACSPTLFFSILACALWSGKTISHTVSQFSHSGSKKNPAILAALFIP